MPTFCSTSGSVCKGFYALALACCLLLAALPARSEEIITTSKDRVSLRDSPGTQSNILRILPLGEELVILKRGAADESGKRWFHVQTRDDWKGYVREDMLSDVSYAPTTRKPLQPGQDAYAPVHDPGATPSPSQAQPAVSEQQPPALDEQPPAGAETANMEPEASTVRRKAPGRDFPDHVSATQEPPLPEETEDVETLPRPTLLETKTSQETARLAHDRVNLREGPGTDTPSLGLLAQGAFLAVLDREPAVQGPDWLLVETDDGRRGFVRQDMLELLDGQPPAEAAAQQPPAPEMRITPASGRLYTVAPGVSLLQTPAPGSPPLARLMPGESIALKGRVRFPNTESEPQDDGDATETHSPGSPQWLQVQTIDGASGFVRAAQVSDLRLELLRQEKLLLLIQGERELARFTVRICEPQGMNSTNGLATEPGPYKHDATPEPHLEEQAPEERIADAPTASQPAAPADPAMLAASPPYPLPGRYTLSPDGQGGLACLCPTARIARQALARKDITYEQYLEVIKAQSQGRRPPRLPLQSGLRVLAPADEQQGCGQVCDTGCVLLPPQAMEKLLETLPRRARLDVYLSESRRAALSMPQYISSRLVGSMYSQLRSPARFSADAAAITPMAYPMGDIPASKGMSTDLVVRALRDAGVDLQAQVHEDVLLHPEAYEWINAANPAIDHRRPRNLAVWLERNTHSLPLDVAQAPETFQPGDVLIFDTGLANGTPYDVAGLVSMERSRGLPMVFTVLEPGSVARNLPLLDGPEPALVGHYRLAHPYEY